VERAHEEIETAKAMVMRLVAVLVLSVVVAGAAAPDLVAHARRLYNLGRFDEAISTARVAGRRPADAAEAALVLARAHLERHRLGSHPDDLVEARLALTGLDISRLRPGNHMELVVGWGELFFLEGQPGVAAEMFETALAHSDLPSPVARDRILDWWAQSVDRLAYGESATTRARLYGRILDHMDQERQGAPVSPVVAYWLAAASRGTGDVDRAWHAAVSGWIRAKLTAGGGTTLRADLDRLVTEAIIPERARQTTSVVESGKLIADLRAEWESIKRVW
jgi:hypothetical protein